MAGEKDAEASAPAVTEQAATEQTTAKAAADAQKAEAEGASALQKELEAALLANAGQLQAGGGARERRCADSRRDSLTRTHAFWDTQPVPNLSESTEDIDDADMGAPAG